MINKSFNRLALALVVVAALTAWLAAGAMADTRQIPAGGTGSPQTGAFSPSGAVNGPEFAGEADNDGGPDAYAGNIVNRSLSKGIGNGVSVNSGKKAKSNPQFNSGFEGLN